MAMRTALRMSVPERLAGQFEKDRFQIGLDHVDARYLGTGGGGDLQDPRQLVACFGHDQVEAAFPVRGAVDRMEICQLLRSAV